MDLTRRTFKGITVTRRSDGYIDATAACQACGKEFKAYNQLKCAQEYLACLSATLNKSIDNLVFSVKGTGTWVHPAVALDLGRWLSCEFAVWLDLWFLEQQQQNAGVVVQTQQQSSSSPFKPVSFANMYRNQLPAISNEADLQAVVVREIERTHPNLILVPGMPPMPDEAQRKVFFQMGYQKGQPDLLILHRSEDYVGLAIEFKHPGWDRQPSEEQQQWLLHLKSQGWQTVVTNDVFAAIRAVDEFARHLWVKCTCGCNTLFRSQRALCLHRDRKRKFEEVEEELIRNNNNNAVVVVPPAAAASSSSSGTEKEDNTVVV